MLIFISDIDRLNYWKSGEALKSIPVSSKQEWIFFFSGILLIMQKIFLRISCGAFTGKTVN
jgi:hypothetical protein